MSTDDTKSSDILSNDLLNDEEYNLNDTKNIQMVKRKIIDKNNIDENNDSDDDVDDNVDNDVDDDIDDNVYNDVDDNVDDNVDNKIDDVDNGSHNKIDGIDNGSDHVALDVTPLNKVKNNSLFDDVEEFTDVDEERLDKLQKTDLELFNGKFNDHVHQKLYKLNTRMRYLDHKTISVKKIFKRFSLAILLISALLTLIESFKNTMNLENISSEYLKNIVKLIPLIFSTVVTIFTAIIKFNKYEDKIEELASANNTCVNAMSEFKKIKERLYFCEDQDTLDEIKDKFSEVYHLYLEGNKAIEKNINDSEYNKYMKKISKIDIENNKIDSTKKKIIKLLNEGKDTSILEKKLNNYSKKKRCACCC